ncbi:MAG: hypothetical protein KIH71_010810 [Roseobacter sp.]|nr:hypothetical protein [Roseobacter sp.]
MVNTNKILTVSYGTFSCTLEGFDDSFGTMKAIAEYFRDLAADDRYFGAEPPSPDAEMLARIAEREISRRVEAHRDDNTFVLRAGPASLPQPAPQPIAHAPDAPQASPTSAAEAAAPAAAPPKAPPVAPEADAQAETQADASQSKPAPQAAPPLTAPLAAAPDRLKPAQDPNSVAAKLQRIRDVVSQHDAEDSYSEDEHADPFLSEEDPAPEDILSSAQNDIAAALAADDALEDARHSAEPEADTSAGATPQAADENDAHDESEEEDISALLDRLATPETPRAPTDGQKPAEPAPAPEAAGQLRARVIKMKKTDVDAALSAGDIQQDDSPKRPDIASSLSDEDEADLMRELAAVEAEAAQGRQAETPRAEQDAAQYDDDAYDEDDDIYNEADFDEDAYDEDSFDEDGFEEDDVENSSIGEGLSDAADATGAEDTAGNLFSDQDAATHQIVASTVRAVRSARLVETATDDQMGRILEETNTKLDEDEGRGRRNAIAHLRAAVQATEAERNMGGDLGADGRDTEVYRDDLETAVRPRRPVHPQGKSRPDMRRAAPLKLVAEQRIDTPKQDGPVRPRRILASESPSQAKAASGTADFSDYVQSVGAQNLSEVLEAAASYMAFVQGQDAFSRPELMSKLNATDHADTSREDRLRSFGQLLRAGKIRKLGGGRFEASEDISYRPTARVAGG